MSALDQAMVFVSVLAVLSASAERLVEILKGYWPRLGEIRADARSEERRKATLQLISVALCLVTAFLAHDVIGAALGKQPYPIADHWPMLLGLGFFAAGGSSFWNSILGYLVSLKKIKKAEAQERVESTGITARLRSPSALDIPAQMPRLSFETA